MRYSSSSDRDSGTLVLAILGLITLALLILVLQTFLMTFAWGQIVPTVFPGAVDGGYLPAALTMFQAFKLSILFWALGLTTASASSSKSKSSSDDGCATTILTYAIAFLIMIPIWAILVAISGAIIYLVWGWVVPDVFSGSVGLGLIPAHLTYWHACLVAVLFSFLGLSNRRASSSSSK